MADYVGIDTSKMPWGQDIQWEALKKQSAVEVVEPIIPIRCEYVHRRFPIRRAQNNVELARLVLQVFIRVLRSYKLHPLFYGACSNRVFGSAWRWLHLEQLRHLSSHFDSIDDILRTLAKIDRTSLMNRSGTESEMIQRCIEHITNTLIRLFIEKHIYETFGHVALIEKIGEKVFTISCKCVFGDEFVDYTENDSEEMKKMINDATSNQYFRDMLKKKLNGLFTQSLYGSSGANEFMFVDYPSRYN